jgi:hypothetical protein
MSRYELDPLFGRTFCPDEITNSRFGSVNWLSIFNGNKKLFLETKLHLDVSSGPALSDPSSTHTRTSSCLNSLVWNSWIEDIHLSMANSRFTLLLGPRNREAFALWLKSILKVEIVASGTKETDYASRGSVL